MRRPTAAAGHRKKSNSNSHRRRSVLLPSIYLTQDLLVEILKRLPAKTLIRFLSVSKQWKTLISSTHFAGIHYSATCAATPTTMKPYLRLHKPIATLNSPNQAFAVDLGANFDLIDVILGVICFADSSYDHIILCNPSIHKYFTLPDTFFCSFIGFGYNSSDSDFKVVKIGFGEAPAYEVYSSRVGTWKNSKSDVLGSCSIFPYAVEDRKGCFFYGTIYWTVYTRKKHSFLMFDCKSEEFTTLELPGEIVSRKMKLMEYAGMLSLVTEVPSPGFGIFDSVELWVMKENDWKRLYRFRDINSYDIYDDSFVKLAPFGPKEWIRWGPWTNLFSAYHGILSGYVYEESMFLMDDDKAKTYRKNEKV